MNEEKDPNNKNEELIKEQPAEETAAEKPAAEAVEKEEPPVKMDRQQRKQQGKIEELQKQIEDLKGQLDTAVNDKYRAYADAENVKKRLHAEADNAAKYRIQSFALDILPALDNMERALANQDEKDPFIKGVQMTYDSLWASLQKEGLTEIDCLNKPFDPNYHHAIMTAKVEGVKPNMVVEVLQKGYMLKDRLLRAPLVKVSE